MSRSLVFKKFILAVLMLFISNNLMADVASLESDYVPGQADVTSKLNNDRHTLTNSTNNIRGVFAGGVQSSGQIKADTVGEENMADDSNPRIRTSEGASCTDLVVSGLLPTTSSSLIGSIPVGVAYPDGYRVEKTSTTAKTFTSSKWTFVYLLTSGSFNYQEVSIGAATPTDPSNSVAIARVSTDSSTIATVTDLRKTSCAAGPFSAIADTVGEANISDLLSYGITTKRFSPAGRTPEGFITGLWVSIDSTTTQFKVTKGSAYINGKYRTISQDVTVPTTAANPSTGVSGIDTASVVSDTTYYVYAVADQSNSKTLSISYSTSSANPSGATNYRLIGLMGTDSQIKFASQSTVVVAHAVTDRETIGASAYFDGSQTAPVAALAYNVSSITKNGTGDYTLNFRKAFNSGNLVMSGTCQVSGSTQKVLCLKDGVSPTASALRFTCTNSAGSAADGNPVAIMVAGDQRQ